ncbi:hypothetical protein MAR_026600 [Mya arenaria]|uniref:Uncharacterized protein n=1 Tax=Mya arenaria TaxID=6604 RepID=A0ABY7ERF2_MYAAR|nr:hypothetical protein MAR_026600 [Mya arenaria]
MSKFDPEVQVMAQHVGFHGNRVHPWDSLVTQIWDDLIDEDRQNLVQIYRESVDGIDDFDTDSVFRNRIGVCICGLGGQGKSCLATQICWTLHEEHNWSVVKVDLRNKKRTEDVWKSVLSKVGAHTPEEANLPKLLNLLKTFICEKTNDDNDDKRVLKPLDEEDGIKLLNTCSTMDIEYDIATEIVRKCACSPLAITIVSELLKNALRGLHGDPFYEPIVHALFHKVKGLVRWKQLKFDEGLNHLNLSLSFYEHYRDFGTEYNMLVCQVKSYIAQVNIDIGNLDVADQCLHEGLNKIKAMIEPPSQSCHDDLATELHWDIPSYYLHWAEIHIAKAKSTSDPDVRAQLSLDEKLKLDYLDNYYSKVKLLADILIEKGLLDEAKKNAEFVLDRRRGILQPPHFKYTESDLENGAYDSVAKSRVKAVREMMWTPMEMLMKLFSKGGREGSGGSEEFGAADQQLQGLENLTEEQRDNFVEGFGGMPSRHDSGHGHSSSDLGDSFSSGSGSMSARIQRMHIEKSVSLEDNVFEKRKKPPLKRSRTNKSEDGN